MSLRPVPVRPVPVRPVSVRRVPVRPSRRASRRALGAAGLALSGIGLSACSASPSALGPFAILVAHSPTRTVQLSLDASVTNANGGLNYDGYGNGALQVTVPVGWTVQVACQNRSATISTSCAVVGAQPVSKATPPIAFQGAASVAPTAGIALGRSESFTFVASRAGRYRIASLVPGQEAGGLWDWLVVTSGGRPSVST